MWFRRHSQRTAKRVITALRGFFLAVFLRFFHKSPMTTEIDPPAEVINRVYPAIGAVVVFWAMLEQSLEHWVAMIYRHPGGNTGYKKVPFLFSPKVEFLREKFSNLVVLKPLAAEAFDIIEVVDRLAGVRDIMVHGGITAYQPDTELLKFIRIRIDKTDNMHTLESNYASIREILETSAIILKYWTRSLHFSKRLLKCLGGEDGQNESSGRL
jgi:hypothetical protein